MYEYEYSMLEHPIILSNLTTYITIILASSILLCYLGRSSGMRAAFRCFDLHVGSRDGPT